MKKLLLAIALLGVFCLSLSAADAPKAEVFGGFQMIRDSGVTINGFNASVAGNISDKFALVGDFGYGTKSGFKEYTYVGGPQISMRADKFRVFVHAMAGGMRFSDEGSISGFAMMLGGGLDFKVADAISIRPAQIDLIEGRMNKTWGNQFRYSAGIVFGLGGK
jgi:hypothetical protein